MKKVRMGIIGLGGMGQQHVRFVRELPEAELTAVSDIDEKITKEISEKYKVPGFVDSRELLESGLVDAVLIATPHYFHPPIGISAMERGIHCLSEKPIAVSVKEGDRFVEASRKNNVVFGVMHQYRTLPEIRLARKIVESGKLGEI
ncbi:MAG TPA: Gfo/Idh/MocA family oxidoreductase, partial [Candidatus Atribacteria bacterium]|nr:Gfo/Idh/MocA family oxidoreductase [Candidatus Atribacteria bacterium]